MIIQTSFSKYLDMLGISAPNAVEPLPYATRMFLVSSEPPPAKPYSILMGGGAWRKLEHPWHQSFQIHV